MFITSQSIGMSVSQPCDVTTSRLQASLPEPPLSAPDPISLVSPAFQNTSPDSTDIDQLMVRAFGATHVPPQSLTSQLMIRLDGGMPLHI